MIRLLHIHTLQLHEFQDDQIPPYAIASHRWLDEEVSKKDVEKKRNVEAAGFVKVHAFCNFLRQNESSLQKILGPHAVEYVWIDTCCIDRRNAVELAEAINSMYRWYTGAEVCLAYLFDVHDHDPASFAQSMWHRRGWTLQELVAPRLVLFLDSQWRVLGHKRAQTMPAVEEDDFLGPALHQALSTCTGIPRAILCKTVPVKDVAVEVKLKWMNGRATLKIEDQAYCLLGIFGVFIPIIYGERHAAKIRLLEEVLTKYKRRERVRPNQADGQVQMAFITDQLVELDLADEESDEEVVTKYKGRESFRPKLGDDEVQIVDVPFLTPLHHDLGSPTRLRSGREYSEKLHDELSNRKGTSPNEAPAALSGKDAFHFDLPASALSKGESIARLNFTEDVELGSAIQSARRRKRLGMDALSRVLKSSSIWRRRSSKTRVSRPQPQVASPRADLEWTEISCAGVDECDSAPLSSGEEAGRRTADSSPDDTGGGQDRNDSEENLKGNDWENLSMLDLYKRMLSPQSIRSIKSSLPAKDKSW